MRCAFLVARNTSYGEWCMAADIYHSATEPQQRDASERIDSLTLIVSFSAIEGVAFLPSGPWNQKLINWTITYIVRIFYTFCSLLWNDGIAEAERSWAPNCWSALICKLSLFQVSFFRFMSIHVQQNFDCAPWPTALHTCNKRVLTSAANVSNKEGCRH